MRLQAAFRIPERKPRCDAGPRRLLVNVAASRFGFARVQRCSR
jgi:hypothetical protein